MKERINRQGDERIYQPKIHKDLIEKLYMVKERTGLPMTVLVDQALKLFLEQQQAPEEIHGVEVLSQDDYEDLSNYLEPYQTDPFGEL